MAREYDLGPATTYAIAVAHGYTGTEEEWLAEQEASRLAAQGAAQDAAKSKEAAANAAQQASEYRQQAVSAADSATKSMTAAQEAAASVIGDAQMAADAARLAAKAIEETAASKSAAEQAAQSAALSESNAAGYKTAAAGSAQAAQGSASRAASAEQNAAASERSAQDSASAASNSEANASAFATSAAGSAQAAQESASAAAASAEKAEAAALRTYKHYITRWDKTTAQLTRLGDAVGITTDTTKFCYRGSDTGDYDNPFDGIYPWSHRRLCNVDLEAYRALEAGASLRGCVSAWEGEPGFSYDDPSGVWVYTPEFWGDAWEDGAYRYYEVADREVAGLIHYPESIGGRWHGAVAQITVGGAQKTGFLPLPGIPGKRIAMSTLHSYAKNGDFTLENIFVYDASSLLYLVEYGNFHSQSALGNGVSDLYTEAEDKFTDAASESITVSILASRAGNVIPGAIFDIGTGKGGNQVGSFTVVSKETDPGDSTKDIITLDRPTTVTTSNYWSIHGLTNTKDEKIGSRSGYIGTNGKSHAYYRGEVFFGNLWRYVLGAYHQATTNHIFLAKSESEADLYDAINTAKHIDTGIEIAASGGYVKSLGFKRAKGTLAIPACTEIGGSSSAPVADYHYNSPSSNTILVAGGHANHGPRVGRFYGSWSNPASNSYWSCGARPFLNSP